MTVFTTTHTIQRPQLPVFESIADEIGIALDIAEVKADESLWVLTWVATDENKAAFEAMLSLTCTAHQLPEPQLVWEEVDNTIDWQAKVMADFPPLQLGHFFIARNNEDAPEGCVRLKVPANMAFGSGEHATTAACLELYTQQIEAGNTFQNGLDMGCGSGILAMGAAKWQNTPFLAVDIDLPSVEICAENCAENDVADKVVCLAGNGFSTPEVATTAPYALIFANILKNPLLDMANDLVSHLQDDGVAILSGFTIEQRQDVEKTYKDLGLTTISETCHGEKWMALAMKKG